MKAKYAIILSTGLIGAILLAYMLRGPVKEVIILPLARLAWLVEGYYGAFPQSVYWVIALAAGVLLVTIRFQLPEREKWHRNVKVKLSPGPVQELAFWIKRGEKGFYSKWQVAHLLGELALHILDQRGRREKHFLRIKSHEWSPPEEVEKYLDAALNTNFVEYSRAHRFIPRPSTPLDLDIEPVIRYLESILESENDNHS